MSGLGLNVTTIDQARAVIRRAEVFLGGQPVRELVGATGTETTRRHLLNLNATRANHLGGRRTQYFRTAANSTSFQVKGDEVVVSINHIGIRYKFYGGTIKPRTAKFLTIPVAPEAHGKRAREFGDLEIVFGKGGRPIGLARKATGKRGFGVMLYRLVRSVTQQPDPSIVPTQAVLLAEIAKAVDSTLQRTIRRRA